MANWLHRCYGTNCVRACVCVFVGVLCVTLMHACVRARSVNPLNLKRFLYNDQVDILWYPWKHS